jgi:hypothetical protein
VGFRAQKQRQPLLWSQQQHSALRDSGDITFSNTNRANRANSAFTLKSIMEKASHLMPGVQQQRIALHRVDGTAPLQSNCVFFFMLEQLLGNGENLVLAAGGVQHAVFLLDVSNFQDTQKVTCALGMEMMLIN